MANKIAYVVHEGRRWPDRNISGKWAMEDNNHMLDHVLAGSASRSSSIRSDCVDLFFVPEGRMNLAKGESESKIREKPW